MAARPLDPETYARVLSALAAGEDRDAVLARHGYDATTFDEAEEDLDARMSHDDEGRANDDAPPPSFVAFDAALRRGQAESTRVLSLERYALALSILETGDRIEQRLARAGFALPEIFVATAHYAPRLAREPELAAAFQRHKKRARDDEGNGSPGG